jgi:hypothetical protein
LAESLPHLEERVSCNEIAAPNDWTPGGFLNTGDVMLESVPKGEALISQAKIMPKDIPRIRFENEVASDFRPMTLLNMVKLTDVYCGLVQMLLLKKITKGLVIIWLMWKLKGS